MRTGWLRAGLLGGLLVVAATAAGQGEAPPEELPELVVTATRSALDAQRVPASFTVIDRRDIERLAAEDLVDLIRATPGITYNGVGIGGRRTLSIRGLSDTQTLVLVDGRRTINTNENIGYSDFGYNWIPLDAIERIEIVRGPLSAVWGAEALGGVVNIITRRPGDAWHGSARLRGALPLEDELGEEAGAWVYAGGPLGDRRLALTTAAEGVRENNIPRRDDPDLDAREDKRRAGARAALSWLPAAGHELELSGAYNAEERYTRGWDARARTPRDYDYDLKRSSQALEYSGELGATTLRARAYRTTIKTTRVYVPQGDVSVKTDDERIVSAEAVSTALRGHLLTVGGELRREELAVPGFDDGLGGSVWASDGALFVQDSFNPLRRLSLILGLRRDFYDRFGGETSPRAYAVWEAAERLQVKGGYGHGFKPPSLKQNHPAYYYEIGSMIIVGNPLLVPETAESFELGARWTGRRGWAAATLYTNAVENLIDNQVIAFHPEDDRPVYQPRNINRARTRGLELEGAWRPRSRWRLGGSYTYLEAWDLTLDRALAGRPVHTIQLALGWGDAAARGAGLRWEWRGPQWLDDRGELLRAGAFGLWHLAAHAELGAGLELQLGLDNLTDAQLDEVSAEFNYYERGRTAHATLLMHF